MEASFVQAFGMSSEDFYAEFDAWLESTTLEENGHIGDATSKNELI